MGEWVSPEGSAEAVLAAFNQPGVMLCAVEGPELTVTAASASVATFAGRGDLVGRPYAEVVPEAQGQEWGDLLRQVRETGEPIGPREWRVEVDRPEEGTVVTYLSLTLQPWLYDEGSVRGVLVHGFDVTEEVTRRKAAEAAGAASERRLLEARDLVHALQDSLLPSSLPVVPGLQTAGRYLLAQEDTAAGGDWLDVSAVPDGGTALVVGDVVGHGVGASTLMGQLRAVLAERLAAGVGIVSSLEALDRFAARTPEARAATVVVVEVDPGSDRVRYCTAGHPPPLVVSADGEARFLPPSGARPLASGGDFSVAEEPLGSGGQVVLYTDGILERPGRTPAQATVELAAVAERLMRDDEALPSAEELPVERMCGQLLELLTRETGYVDDITILAAQRVPAIEPLEVTAQAWPAALREVRRAVTAWLEPVAVRPLDEMALQHALGECVTNVIDHAYLDHPETEERPVRVSVALDRPGTATVTVADRGSWHYGNELRERGRGLQMVNTMTDHVTIDRQPDGTTVTLSCPLARSVELMQGDAPGESGSPVDGEFATEQSDRLLTVRGSVDTASRDEFRSILSRLLDGGQPEVRVDLSRVTILASCGVQVLYDALDRASRQGMALRLTAARGSVAQHVLDLVGLPHADPGGSGQNGEAEVDI